MTNRPQIVWERKKASLYWSGSSYLTNNNIERNFYQHSKERKIPLSERLWQLQILIIFFGKRDNKRNVEQITIFQEDFQFEWCYQILEVFIGSWSFQISRRYDATPHRDELIYEEFYRIRRIQYPQYSRTIVIRIEKAKEMPERLREREKESCGSQINVSVMKYYWNWSHSNYYVI